MPRKASLELESFIDEAICRCKRAQPPYHPVVFQRMRHDYGTLDAIERLVRSGEIQSGFDKLKTLNMLEWTIESAVLKFPNEFGREIQQAARWRLDYARSNARV